MHPPLPFDPDSAPTMRAPTMLAFMSPLDVYASHASQVDLSEPSSSSVVDLLSE
jgi:hypothetical protein